MAQSFAMVLVFVFYFIAVAIGVHTVLSLNAVLLICSLHCFIKNHHSCGNWGCGFIGTRREISLPGSGGVAQFPSGSIFHSTIHCNLYLRHVWTWLSDCGNFICDSWNISPCRNKMNSEDGIWKHCPETLHYELLYFCGGVLNLNLFWGSNSPRTLVQFLTSFPRDG